MVSTPDRNRSAYRLAAPFQQGTLPQSVLVAAGSNGPLTPADEATVTRVEAAVRRVRGVVDVRDQGVSRDGQARRAAVTLVGDADAEGTNAARYVDAIRAALRNAAGAAPAGLSFYLTGDVATTVDNGAASSSSLALTEIVSFIVILALLFLVYRSLLAPTTSSRWAEAPRARKSGPASRSES